MQNDNTAIEVQNLIVHYETEDGIVEAVNDVSFSIKKGEVMGLVGETGAGKTTIALSVMGLLPKPPANMISGEIILDGENLTQKSPWEKNQHGLSGPHDCAESGYVNRRADNRSHKLA